MENDYFQMRHLKTNRGLFKYLVFSILTLGIYSIVVFSKISKEINLIACKRDRRHTMHFCLMFFLLRPITFGIAHIIWMAKLSERIGEEEFYRTNMRHVGVGTYLGWGIFGSLLIGIGPLIFYYKLFKAMNNLNYHYNING